MRVKTIIVILSLLLPLSSAISAVVVPLDNSETIVVLGLFKDRAVIRIGKQQHILRVGETSPEGVSLIEADSKKAVLEFRGKKDTYFLGRQVSSHFKKAEIKGEAKIWPINGMYMVGGTINGQPVKFMLDTGASWISMNAQHARRLGLDYRVSGRRRSVSTASGVAQVFLINLDRVSVGDIILHHVKAAVLEGHSPTEILLGMSFLERVDIQRQGQMMTLKKKW
ncbi:hypothetical protein MNBD_GAMMA24-2136 [hydrothermal vent metagenome]|uniref:TIGR02281 family clan AA aspartic protease n=1 Tax=hydrothermal vent metagenome TaxID=652676 RepID=A0A3B1B533_9ZZZZ